MESTMNLTNSSTVSSCCEINDYNPILAVQKSVRNILKSRIFLGRYIERRLVDERRGYKDVILLSAAEQELKNDLIRIKKMLISTYPRTFWIGITDTDILGYNPPGYCLWTDIEGQPLGPFWFQIKNTIFQEDEIIISVKCLRFSLSVNAF